MRLETRTLKALTSLFFVIGILLLISWQALLGPRPVHGASLADFKSYSYRTLVYMCALLTTALCSGIGAIALYRRITSEYQAEAVQNLRDLIEGSVAKSAAAGSGAETEPSE